VKVTLVMVDRRHLQAGFVLTEPEVNWQNQTFTLVTFGLLMTSRFIITQTDRFAWDGNLGGAGEN
jgi:hypothetical protein